jgi:RNA-directed DNA polymerase
MDNNQDKVGANGQYELLGRRRREIPDAERVQTLLEKLYHKAKQDKSYKFYVLYDKMFIPYLMREAWNQVKANDGAPGVDNVTIQDVEKIGVDTYLAELGEDLRKQTYKPKAVKRVMIPKANGGERPIGIPTVRDRIAQTVCKMIIEPIFEADFSESSHGFRQGRYSGLAMEAIKKHLKSGDTMVLDADLSNFFDTIPHDKLMTVLGKRISDPRLLKLINKWLKAPVFDKGQFTGGKKNNVGTPQGGVISPLLANIYMNLIDRLVDTANLFTKYGIKIVRYADDFVLMGKSIPKEALEYLKSLLTRMGLTLNESKTRMVNATEETFNFLGFTIRYSRDLFVKGKKYWDIIPSAKSQQRIRDNVREYLQKHGHSNAKTVSRELNAKIRGWLNYFSVEGVSYPTMAKRRLRHYLSQRLYRYYNRKSQRKSRLFRQDAFGLLVNQYGLIDPTKYSYSRPPVKTYEEVYGKAVCGKTARTV